ncbi:MAG: alpha/beta hydrolase [Bacteroidota bacterium]
MQNNHHLLFLVFYLFSSALTAQEWEEYMDLPYLSPEQTTVADLQRLNLVVPQNEETVPLLIWIGGGAWSYVDRHVEMDLARQFAERGIAVASIGHRLSPATWRDPNLNTGIQHPKHVEDIAAAVQWLYEQAAHYGYDSEQFFIGGFSSGAHLAALVALDSTHLQARGLSPRVFRGIIPISGTYDIADYHRAFSEGSRPDWAELHVEAVFGSTEEQWAAASPTNFLDYLSQPILLMTDQNMYRYTQLFEDRLLETNFRDFQVVYAYELSHVELWQSISRAESSAYRDLMVHFIQSNS